MGERRDAVVGEGVADITCPFLNEEDVSESFDTLRPSGGEFSRAGVGVVVNGSCFWKPASSVLDRIRRIGGLEIVFVGVSSSSRELAWTESWDCCGCTVRFHIMTMPSIPTLINVL